jgi:hypothetical protein
MIGQSRNHKPVLLSVFSVQLNMFWLCWRCRRNWRFYCFWSAVSLWRTWCLLWWCNYFFFSRVGLSVSSNQVNSFNWTENTLSNTGVWFLPKHVTKKTNLLEINAPKVLHKDMVKWWRTLSMSMINKDVNTGMMRRYGACVTWRQNAIGTVSGFRRDLLGRSP